MPVRARPAHLLLGLLVTGCSDLGTESFDPMASSQKAQEAFARVTNNAAVKDFTALQTAFSFTAAPPITAAPAAAAAPADILPAGAAGKTFTYNTNTGEYSASGDPGAPANGARFVLYELTGTAVTVPLVPIGTLDLTNESSPAPNSLGVKAVINGVTLVDYKATGSLSGGVFVLTAKGLVSDGPNRLDFDLSQNFSSATGLKIDYKVSAPSPDIAIHVVSTHTGGTSGPTTATLTVTEGQNKLVVEAAGSSSATVTGTVEYNKHEIAKVTGTAAAPVFTGQGGRTLTAQEIEGLKKLFDFVNVLLEGVDEVLIPAYFVLGFNP